MLIENAFKAPLSQAIQTQYNKLVLLISQVSDDSRLQKKIKNTDNKISVADLIAYQIGWGTLLIGWYESGIRGETPQMPGEGFSKWNYKELARHFYIKYQYDSSKQQEREFYTVVCHILEIVEREYQRGNLDQLGVWPWCTLSSGKKWPLSKWITVNTVAPYKRASALVRNFLKKQF